MNQYLNVANENIELWLPYIKKIYINNFISRLFYVERRAVNLFISKFFVEIRNMTHILPIL